MSKIIHLNVKKNIRIHLQKLVALEKLYIARPRSIRTPELGSKLKRCIEAKSVSIKTAED